MSSGAWADISQADLLVDGKYINDPEGLNIGGPMLDASIVRSIEQASTIAFTMFDPNKDLLNSRLVTEKIKCNVGTYGFKLAAVEKSGENVILTFEDEAISLLRDHATPRKASRAKVTRAEFAKMLVEEESGLTFFSTELKNLQPVANHKGKPNQSTRDANKEYGFPDKIPSDITVRGGHNPTRKQMQNADDVLRQGTQMSADKFTLITGLAVAIDESSLIAVDHGDAAGPSSRGLFQQQDNGAWATAPKGSAASLAQRMDPSTSAMAFFKQAIKARKAHPEYTYTELAHAVQGNADPNVYAQWVAEAKKIYDLWYGIIPSFNADTPSTATVKKPYEFHRGGPGHRGENTWQCLLRLAQEVNWLCFCVGMTIYFLPAVDLYTSRPIATIDEDTDGIEGIDFQYDLGKNVTQATVTCHAEKWQVDPGAVIILQNMGPASGRWIVSEIDRSLFDTQATINLVKPTNPLPEPAATNISSSKAKGTLLATGELNGFTVVETGLSLLNPNGYRQAGVAPNHANHPGVSLKDYLQNHKTEKPPFDCSSFVRWIWMVGGHIDIGDTNVAGQVAHAKTTSWLQGGPGTQPPGGFQEGDVLALHTSEGDWGHTVVCAGGTDTIEAQSTRTGIVKGTMPSTWEYWYRPEPAKV